MKELIEKGIFEPIDNIFMTEGVLVLRELARAQKRFEKMQAI